MTVERSLFLHSHLRRRPHQVLHAMLDLVQPDMPPNGPDGPVAVLERRMAELLGKEAALFFPSGTMAQQVALRLHADRRGRRAFAAHPQSHLEVWEHHGYSVVHGLRCHLVGDRHRLMTLADLSAVGEPLAAVVWELPQRDIGGLLPEWDELVTQTGEVRDRGAAAHLDGARLWEAQTFYRRPFAEIAALFDTVYVSLYKGLQGTGGAILAADAATAAEASVWRRRLGGDLNDAWPVALAALHGLDNLLPRLPAHRDHAIAVAAAINADGVARAVPDPPQTPLFHVHLPIGPAVAERAAAALLAETGIELFGRVRSAPDPGRCSFEVSVGENAMAFTPDEVVGVIRDLLRRAGTATSGSDGRYDVDYDGLYRDTADSGGPPWDIGGPQPALAAVLDSGVKGPKVLDIGCGTGDLAIALARRGYDVTAVDISRVAIDLARAKAAREGLTVHFEAQDATTLSLPSAPFDSVFDSGLLHSLHRRGGGEMDTYLALLPGLAAPGATVFVLAVSFEAAQGWGVTEALLRASFAEPQWVDTQVERIDVAAQLDGEDMVLPGFLLRTVRADGAA